MAASKMHFNLRPSETRGGGNHGWLRTFHTFNFAGYQDGPYEQFGCLRVINEDRVAPHTGFPTHPHANFEIFSYLVSGQLSHKDSMGNVEVMKRGDVQMTSGGTGIRHSEYNDHGEEVHFLQIWALPTARGLKPQYFTRHFPDAARTGKIVQIVGPADSEGVVYAREGDGPAPVHAPLRAFSTLLPPSASVTHTLTPLASTPSPRDKKRVYLQVVQSSGYSESPSIKSGDRAVVRVAAGAGGEAHVLGEGDGLFVEVEGKGEGQLSLTSEGGKVAEVVLFEMDA